MGRVHCHEEKIVYSYPSVNMIKQIYTQFLKFYEIMINNYF